MIHKAEMVIGVRFPRPVDLDRAGGLAAWGVAQVGGDAAVLSLKLFNGIIRRIACKEPNGRVQSAARKQHERETGTGFLIVDADGSFFVELASSGLARLLSKYPGHGRSC